MSAAYTPVLNSNTPNNPSSLFILCMIFFRKKMNYTYYQAYYWNRILSGNATPCSENCPSRPYRPNKSSDFPTDAKHCCWLQSLCGFQSTGAKTIMPSCNDSAQYETPRFNFFPAITHLLFCPASKAGWRAGSHRQVVFVV